MATRPISRRDFLKGAGIAVGGSALIGLGTINPTLCTKNKKNQGAGVKLSAGITVISRSLRAMAADWRPNSVR